MEDIDLALSPIAEADPPALVFYGRAIGIEKATSSES
jgi:hypothetical protein